MEREGKGKVLDQFANADNFAAHVEHTGPEIWRDTAGTMTHFVSSMGTTGTIMGSFPFPEGKKSEIEIIGLQPTEEQKIPGIRRWPEAYLPKIFERERVDRIIDINQKMLNALCAYSL